MSSESFPRQNIQATSLSSGGTWQHIKIDNQFDHQWTGISLSGIRTSITNQQLGLCFDVAQGYPFALNMKHFFITHGHLDHAAGIPYIISQKAINHQPAAHFYMPKSLVDPMKRIMNIWEEIEQHQYNYIFTGIDENSEIEINPQMYVRPFKTVHRVDSFGYSLIQKKKKILPQYKDLSQNEIVNLKKSGQTIQALQEDILFSFTGDTQIECLDCSPQIKKSQTLFFETTYLDDRKSIEHAKKWGHTHLDELIARLPEIESEKIVLIHISSRYSTNESLAILKKKIPTKDQDRVVLFPGR